jgi:hypothetical protein
MGSFDLGAGPASEIRLLGDMGSGGAQGYQSDVRLLNDVAMAAGGDVLLAGTTDGASTLTVNTPAMANLTGAVGAGTALDGLSVQATAGIGTAAVSTTGPQNYVTSGNVELNGTAYSSAGGAIGFDTGRDDVPEVATVYSTGGGDVLIQAANQISFQQNDKLTSPGDLILRAPTVTVGDLFALGRIFIFADLLQFVSRAPGTVVQPSGSIADRGVDVVGVGGISVSRYAGAGAAAVTTIGGAGLAPIFAAEDVADIQGVPGTFLTVQLEDLPAALLNGTTLDAVATGLSSTEISTVLAGASPDTSDKLVLPEEEGIGAALREELAYLGIFARELRPEELVELLLRHVLYNDIPDTGGLGAGRLSVPDLAPWQYQVATRRISKRQAEETLATYRNLFFEEGPDGARGESRAQQIGDAFQNAVDDYLAEKDRRRVDGGEFAEFLRQKGKHPQALQYSRQLARLYGNLKTLGLSPLELDISMQTILEAIPVRNMDVRAFADLVREMADNVELAKK